MIIAITLTNSKYYILYTHCPIFFFILSLLSGEEARRTKPLSLNHKPVSDGTTMGL
jgi:hypothetical protein